MNTFNKFCVWGFKNSYNTFRHIHEAFYRALKFMGKEVMWLDDQSDISSMDFSHTFFITMNYALDGIPRRSDCFYAVHNIEQRAKEVLSGLPLLNYGLYVDSMNVNGSEKLAEDTFFNPQPWENYASVVFRWGTDLLPPEIEANKTTKVFQSDSDVCNFVGTATPELVGFQRACEENGKKFQIHTQVSVEDNVRLIKESYIAPAINIPYQTEVGYIPCRIFKNISYGQYGVTNSAAVDKFFNGRLIYNPDSYELFYTAKKLLPLIEPRELHILMDHVAANHTYLNKIDALLKAAQLMEKA